MCAGDCESRDVDVAVAAGGPFVHGGEPYAPVARHRGMKKTIVVAVAAFALTACGQASPTGEDVAEPVSDEPVMMPAVIYTVSETDSDGNMVMEAVVKVAEDGTWDRSGDVTATGQLADDQVLRIAELVEAEDFPHDHENELVCATVLPPYVWSLEVGVDVVSNANDGCVNSEPAQEIVEIIQDVADVGPTLEENR